MIRVLKPAKLITAVTIFLILLFAFSSIVSARHFSITHVKSHKDATSSASKKEERKALREEKLEAKKLQICERVESKIENRSVKMVNKEENMVTRFDKIATKVKDYYTDKLLPKGGTIDNYDALVADVAAHEAAVNDAVATAQSGTSSFDCDANDPKGRLGNFKVDMKSVITSLKEYRTSVVNLLVAVRTKGKNIKSPGATSSAEPTTSA